MNKIERYIYCIKRQVAFNGGLAMSDQPKSSEQNYNDINININNDATNINHCNNIIIVTANFLGDFL